MIVELKEAIERELSSCNRQIASDKKMANLIIEKWGMESGVFLDSIKA